MNLLERVEGLDSSLEDLKSRYSLDRKELGKIMIIASTALLVVSVHAAMTLQSNLEEIEKTSKKLDRVQGIIGTDRFQNSLEALADVKGTSVGRSARTAVAVFREANESITRLEALESRTRQDFRLYQYLVLASLLGISAGLSVRYM
ncbi:MAG: hypothetical protein ABEK01_00180 [Candidatus Nanohaloarchaea archaeon]